MPSSPATDLAQPKRPEGAEPLVLAVAPNGARKGRNDHPLLPILPSELAECAAACRDAGASMLHLHVRNADGRHSLAAEDYRPAIDAIRRTVGDSLVLQLTSEAVGQYKPAEQIAMVRELRPEAVSLALKEIIPDEESEGEAASFFAWAHDEHIVAQYILYGPEDVTRYVALRRRGLIPGGRHWVLFVLGRYSAGQRSSPSDLLPFMEAWRQAAQLTEGVRWSICAFGPREIECALTAAALGGDARIGFENNMSLPGGRLARDNAELLSCFAGLARQLGHSFLEADTLRRLFQ